MRSEVGERVAHSKLILTSLQTVFGILGMVFLAGFCGCFQSHQQVHTSFGEIAARPKVVSGDNDPMAPVFTLLNQDGLSVDLQRLRGSWVILYFYPKGDTPSCACVATEYTKLLIDFRNMSANLFGISQDTVKQLDLSREKYSLELDLLSDPEGDTMRSYGALVDSQFGSTTVPIVIRTTILIDPRGRVRFYWSDVIAEGHVARVKEQLEQFQRNDSGTF